MSGPGLGTGGARTGPDGDDLSEILLNEANHDWDEGGAVDFVKYTQPVIHREVPVDDREVGGKSASAGSLHKQVMSAEFDLGFHREMFRLALEQDGLSIVAKGLGSMLIIVKLLQYFCNRMEKSTKRIMVGSKPLIFVVNASEDADIIQSEVVLGGLETAHAPPVSVTAKLPSQDRKKMYANGGCFIVTSRILVVDLLTKVINISQITGFIVNNSERLADKSNSAFALNIVHSSGEFKGFVKAFSDAPETLSSKFGFLGQVMTTLGVNQVYLWPRFHAAVKKSLNMVKPEVIEVAQPLTKPMQRIQDQIVAALDMCLQELRRTQNLELSDLTVENGLFRSFEVTLRRQLDPLWHKVSFKTKQLVQDVGVLRKLLPDLIRFDAVMFLRILTNIMTKTSDDQQPPLWLLTDAADEMFSLAKRRVFRIVKEKIPKVSTSSSTKPKREEVKFDPALRKSRVLDKGGKHTLRLDIKVESSAKIELLNEVLRDIDKETKNSASRGGAEIIVFCRDEQTCTELADVLWRDGDAADMIDERFTSYVTARFKRWCEGSGRKSLLLVGDEIETDTAKAERLGKLETLAKELWAGEWSPKSGASEPPRQMTLTDEQRLLYTEAIRRLLLRERGQTDGRKTESTLSNMGNRARCMIFPYQNCKHQQFSILQEMSPCHVILYNPEVRIVREVEIYQAQNPETRVKLYFLQYEDSVEEQRYLSDLKREQDTFRKLIDEKAGLVLSTRNELPVVDATSKQAEINVQENAIVGYNLSTGEAIRGSELNRSRNSKAPVVPKVVVDMREFRSALPSMLHRNGVHVHPATLEVGDYILCPEIVVERKSIPDLHGSFNSGRLFTQAEAMCKYYARPNLLIEFDETRPFSLQAVTDIFSDISHASVVSKMVLLILHFPSLRLLWSPSPVATVELFKLMKANYDNPDPEVAVRIGVPEIEKEQGEKNDNDIVNEKNETACTLLRRLPGITVFNYQKVIDNVTNLQELSMMTVEQLSPLLGKPGAEQLYHFFNQQPPNEKKKK